MALAIVTLVTKLSAQFRNAQRDAKETELLFANLLLYVDSQFASPYAMSAFVAMHEKRLRFDIATIDLEAKANHEAKFAAASLTHRIPTLVYGDFSLSESSAISEYIDEVFPGPSLYPAVSKDRARAH